ncbi:M15 family metallopeptidase [Microlunatus sp. Gsoil 973]|uniref:M15 family metallopeptidase n=1 Tax=Microlunatus sp. Gsoil 973 TaxID=2672569 RepID=UPI0012B49008|nr:M15 family metallopeptidase [Microlunatus sp. Gsoil 973]QGN34556.1 hypothetical protein GJV80_18955 [Microlunatus sp. Gsoil 973]
MTTAPAISLAVKSVGGPVAGQFFQDLGSFRFTGTATPARDGRRVEIWYLGGNGTWHRTLETTTDGSGHYSVDKPVTIAAVRHFRATLGGNPAAGSTISSAEVSVTVHDATVRMKTPPATIDALKNPTVSGSVYPARSGVLVHFQVRRVNGSWHDKASKRTGSKGKYSFSFTTGNGLVRKYYVRARYWDHRAGSWETGRSAPIARTKVLNAQVTRTTAAEVADTYRSGCPVGPSTLRTIRLNYYGLDKRMHRGVIILAAGRVKSAKASFKIGLAKGFRIRRMTNPNHWGGSDPKQMEADNSSGFNCRKVTGNPYAQSPHSYGIAIDVNTRENPYRDVSGKWWPKSGKAYIKRSPYRQGMLFKSSSLTKAFRHRGYFWGGFWNPGKDYQHFEYN